MEQMSAPDSQHCLLFACRSEAAAGASRLQRPGGDHCQPGGSRGRSKGSRK